MLRFVHRRFARAAGLAGLVLTLVAQGAPAAHAATRLVRDLSSPVFQEFQDPTFRQPQSIAVGPDGNFWITEAFGGEISRMTPSGQFTEFRTSDSHPQSITRGSDGNMWFTENNDQGGSPTTTAGHIGRITMAGQITEFSLPTPFNKPYAITAGGDGNVWFTEDGSKIGRITPSGQITEFAMPTQQALSDAITLGPDGNVWFTESLTDKVASVNRGGHITEYDLPNGTDPEGIVTGPDHNLWIVESGSDNIARLDVRTHALTEFPIPTPNPSAQLITVGSDGNLYFTEQFGSDFHGAIGRISTSGVIAEFEPPTPRNGFFGLPFGITAGPDGNVWFTEEVDNDIVSLTIPVGEPGAQATGATSVLSRSAHQPPPVPELFLPEHNLVSPIAVTEGPDGNTWFTERFNAAIGRVGPNGKITEFPATEAAPESFTAGPNGALWYCGADTGVVRLTTTGVETDFPIPAGACNYITSGVDGNLWYTASGVVGRLTPSGIATEFTINADGPIVEGPNGNVWVTQTDNFGQSGELLRVAHDGTVTSFPMTGFSSDFGTNPMTFGPDGNLWMVADAATTTNGSGFTSVVARVNPTTGDVSVFPAGVRLAIVQSITSGPDGNIWFDFGGNGTGPAGVVKMSTKGTILSRQLLPAGFATPQGIAVGPATGDNQGAAAVYVAESLVDHIAYLNVSGQEDRIQNVPARSTTPSRTGASARGVTS